MRYTTDLEAEMTILTRKQALEDCIKVWTYLAETGSDSKSAAIDAALDYSPAWDCPACEYDAIHNHTDHGCAECPVDAWRNSPTCTDPASPFAAWAKTRSPDVRRAEARRIIRLCQESLDRLEEPCPTPPNPPASWPNYSTKGG